MANGKGGLLQLEKPAVKPEPVFKFVTYAVVKSIRGETYAARIHSNEPVIPHNASARNTAFLQKRLKTSKVIDIETVLRTERNARIEYIKLDRNWASAQKMKQSEISVFFKDASNKEKMQQGIYAVFCSKNAYDAQRNLHEKFPNRPIPVEPAYELVGQSEAILKAVPKRRKKSG